MAEFKYYLNRQGVRGPQGEKGEKGFSPDISVEKDTPSEYVLRITNEGGYFLTANLREHKEDRGGTYIRYDRATGVMYAGDAELATTDTLGVIRIAKDEDFTGKAEDAAVTPAQVQDYTTAKIAEVNQRIDSLDANNVKVTGDQAIDGRKVFRDRIESNYVYTDHVYGSNGERIFINEDILGVGNTQKPTILYSKGSGITLNGNTDYILTQSRVTAGDGVAIEKTASGVKITSNTPANVVTTDTDQTITGMKTFTGRLSATKLQLLGFENSGDEIREQAGGGINITDRIGQTILTRYSNNLITLGNSAYDLSVRGKSVTNQAGEKYLTQGNVAAGNNISIEETTDGIKISSTGGGAGDVTLAGDNSFTGNNTFDGETTFNAHTWTAEQEAVTLNVISNATLKNAYVTGTLSSLSELTAVSISAAGIKNSQNNKYYLNQASITAGSDNLVIAETETGVQLTVNAPTNAQIEALQRLINDLSTKVDNLTTRLNNLEEVIDGGVAGSIYPADPQKIDANPVVDNAINTGETSGSVDITVEDN